MIRTFRSITGFTERNRKPNILVTEILPRPGYGGRRCDQCEVDMWGDPQEKCIPCNCNEMGVNPDHTQCDTTTGKCHCLEGLCLVCVEELHDITDTLRVTGIPRISATQVIA